MVANDQAYDSHAAQGYGLNNDKAVAGKDTGGTYRDLIYLGTDNLMHLGPWDGWEDANESWTYASADAPTFVITVPTNATLKYSVGMRIKLTQTTVKYFIITAVAATTLTVYGGTDYTLANAAISANFYSSVKAPFGFPLDPAKWTVEATDVTERLKISPTTGVWYNLGDFSLAVPLGAWRLSYSLFTYLVHNTSGPLGIAVTLSTAANSQSEVRFTSRFKDASNQGPGQSVSHWRGWDVILAAKTPYYLNTAATEASTYAIHNYNNALTAVIRAVCAYL